MEKLSPGTVRFLRIITRCMGIALFLFAAYNFVSYGLDLIKSKEVSPGFRIPYYPITFGLAVSCFLQAMTLLCDLLKTIKEEVMSEITVGIIASFILLLFFLAGMELAFGMAFLGVIGFAYLVSFSAASNLLVKDFFDTFTSYGFTVIPLFVLMGQIASHSNIAKRLYLATHKFVGHIPGGLAMTTVGGATIFKAVCGSTLATAAAFAGIAIPEMDRYGYDKRLSTGVVASVGTLGVLIPPSIVLIIYAIIVEESIGKMFLAGIIPGIIIALFFMVVIYGWVKINPAIAPATPAAPWSERIRVLPEFLWVAIIFLVIIGGMMKGIFSPTEGGSIGTLAILIMAAARRELTFKGSCSIGHGITQDLLHGAHAHSGIYSSRPFSCRN